MHDPAAPAVVDDIEVETSGPVEEIASPEPVALSADPGDEDGQEVEAADPASEAGKTLNAKKSSLQARIDKAVAAQREAERRAEAAEQRAREYEARTRPQEPQAKREPQYTRPKPTDAEVGEGLKYATYPDFIEDLNDWKDEQREVARQAQARQHAQLERHESHANKFRGLISKAEESDPAFWSKMSKEVVDLAPSTAYSESDLRGAAQAANRGDRNAQQFLSKVEIADAIFDSDYATDLMAHFSANTNDLQRLSTLPPRQIAREIGRIEAQFTRTGAATSGPAPKTPVSQAPPPIKPVGTTASTTDRDPLSEDLDMDEHIRVMNAREKRITRRR